MMSEYREITEFLSFVAAADLEKTIVDDQVCIDRISSCIDEEFLVKRGILYRREYEKNSEFREAILKLSSICNDNEMKCNECPINKYCNHYIKQCREYSHNNEFTMVDLFCGAGGLSLGFCQAGFVTILANDIQDCCVDTYAHNHPEVARNKIILGDVTEVADNINNLLEETKPCIVVGGPPCQGFSMANRQRIIDDPRNILYKQFIRVVDRTKPLWVVMENVKGMLTVKDQVIEDFRRIGYLVEARLLNAKDYGVPQHRERLIYIGNRVGEDNKEVFDKIEKESKKIPNYVLDDALYGLRPLSALTIRNATEVDTVEAGYKIERGTCDTNDFINFINMNKIVPITCNHKTRYNNERDIEIYGTLKPGENSSDPKIAHIMPYVSRGDIFKDKYYKLIPNRVSKTITAHMKTDTNSYIHPYQARGLTPREAARIQTYPDDYFFRGIFRSTYMQIGNSVPPALGRAIAIVVKEYVEKYLCNLNKD